MSLLTPDLGLLFWMLLSFGIVFALLAKFGFPVIIRMVDERREFISQSLAKADEANRAFDELSKKADAIMAEARSKQTEIIKLATIEAEKIVRQAKDDAIAEGRAKMQEALRSIDNQKQKALGEIRTQTAELAVLIAEKIIRRSLERDSEQERLITALLDEIEISTLPR